MPFKTWLLFLVMETSLSLSPGPAVFYVVAQGIRGGMGRTAPSAGGILSANAIYFALSATSLGAMIATSATFFTVVKWAGAGYLIYLGVKSLRAASTSTIFDLRPVERAGAPNAAAPMRAKAYLGALTLQLANPKALLFFLALLPQFIDPQRPVVAQMLILAATSMVPEFLILLTYGTLAHRAARASATLGVSSGINRWLARVEGIGLLACALLVLKFRATA